LFSDCLDRTVIHYAVIVGASRSILQLVLDYNEELTLKGTHLDEALKEFMTRK